MPAESGAERRERGGEMAGGGERLMPCARAKFEFRANSEQELGFGAGVSLRLLRRIDDNWLEGELEGKVGIFPASYVEIELGMPSLARERELARSGRPYAIGLFDFPGDCEGDLGFSKGELVELLGPAGPGWLRGRTGTGEGIFPASFVEILKLPVSPSETTASGSPRLSSDETRRSPEYAEPGETLCRSEGVREGRVGGEEGEGVFENGFSDEDEEEEELRPVPRPQRTRKSHSVSAVGERGGGGGGEGGGTTPSRTPPASPVTPRVSRPPRRQVCSHTHTHTNTHTRHCIL